MDHQQAREVWNKMSDEERRQLAEKMDKDLDDYMDQLEKSSSKYMDGWSEDNWEQEMEQHPFFTKKIEEGQELSPLLQGIQDLKYSPEENTPEELAKNYKDDGNFNFKCKKYRFAVASYSEGLKQKCPDDLLNAQLFTNRAAAQYHVGNYRSALIDCRLALKKVPNHSKAIIRGAQCCAQLNRFDEGKLFCDQGLVVDPKNEVLLKLRANMVQKEKEIERNKRKEMMAEKKKKADEAKILNAIKERGIKIAQVKGSSLSLEELEPKHPGASGSRVHFDPDEPDHLVWPVLFLYPEYGETDFIQAFKEDQTFDDHLEVMFGPDVEPAPWDQEKKYKPDKMRLFFEDVEKQELVSVSKNKPLREVLSDKRYRVKGGTPGFIVIVEGSKFYDEFLKKYNK